ncbi:unnamed protein product, partial [Onchocerca ochengi]
RTSTTSYNTQHPSTQAGHTLLGADSPTAIHSGRASLGSIIRGTKGHLSSILGSVTQRNSLSLAPWEFTPHLLLVDRESTFTSTLPSMS